MNDRTFNHSRQMLEEHEHLRELVTNLIDFLDGDPRPGVDTAQVIGELVDELKIHFAAEEKGGYLATALAQAPRLTGRADDLFKQHAQLLEKSIELLNQAQRGDGSAGWWASIRSEFGGLAKQLQTHELAENDLVQEAFTEDIGAED